MIPLFYNNGNLPPGIYIANLPEIEARFAYNPRRIKLFRALKKVVKILAECNCLELFLDGSFITNTAEPNDYDICWEPVGVRPTVKLKEILKNLEHSKKEYLGDIFVRLPQPPFYFDHVIEWQKDRDGNTKGIIKLPIGKNHDQE